MADILHRIGVRHRSFSWKPERVAPEPHDVRISDWH
ncbi:hypothetical protein BZB76_1350 [Actinomadura pelletieri DSM 43383]|uniref:Uncharacterized protein n=1 Tax=Actinomadura pelletieri DSM 43383 TaxID=1120940 RepID=A0A495R085_9ACTN|nr:hypothetical protein BZB76_1350 [Actinomadura pelletieri DSM 43383]